MLYFIYFALWALTRKSVFILHIKRKFEYASPDKFISFYISNTNLNKILLLSGKWNDAFLCFSAIDWTCSAVMEHRQKWGFVERGDILLETGTVNFCDTEKKRRLFIVLNFIVLQKIKWIIQRVGKVCKNFFFLCVVFTACLLVGVRLTAFLWLEIKLSNLSNWITIIIYN